MILGLVFVASGCRVDLEADRPATAAGGAVAVAPTPPPAPGPIGEKVYQMLYAGEFAGNARPQGDRLRLLAWMDAARFTPPQLDQLVDRAWEMRGFNEAEQAELAALGSREEVCLKPIYAEMTRLYAKGAVVNEGALSTFALRLEEARRAVVDRQDPRARRYAQVYQQISSLTAWASSLSPAQQAALASSRFVLARRLGPLTDPGDYGAWMGSAWNGADFASLRTSGRSPDEGQMEIGGLWTSENSDAQAFGVRGDLRVGVLLAFVLEMDGFVEAVQVRKGERDADDFTPAPKPN